MCVRVPAAAADEEGSEVPRTTNDGLARLRGDRLRRDAPTARRVRGRSEGKLRLSCRSLSRPHSRSGLPRARCGGLAA